MNPYMSYSRPPPAYSGPYYSTYRSATPSPAASPHVHPAYYYSPNPTRPGTARPAPRTHHRHSSTGHAWSRYNNDTVEPQDNQTRGAFSPRYHSSGYYATAAANVSRQHSWSASRPMSGHSHFYRTVEDSDEEDDVHVENWNGHNVTHQQTRPRFPNVMYNFGMHGTDHDYYFQGPKYSHEREDVGSSPQYNETPPRHAHDHATTPRRSQTTRPQAVPRKPPKHPAATEADAAKHRIPKGYSLKNWDPAEEPFILLGSVFDANSLGKWIYDWTVYLHTPTAPISDIAGELWLILIQLAGKVKRAEECIPRIRSQDNREMVEDFIASGERLTDKLQKLLKTCETPMLRVCRTVKGVPQLGKSAGIEFVDCMFGRDRQLHATEKFMASVRLWNLRFDANCEEILRHPES